MMKILIIEDEKLLADSLKTMLESKGFETEVAYDGETGEEYALLGIYDLLILDVMMPKMDGYAVARGACPPLLHSHTDAHGPFRSGGPCGRAQRRSGLLSDQAL